MKNIVASAAVARERKFAEPVAPKRLEEAPPPKPEPMSAPLPCCRSTRPMMASATRTCATMIMFVQNPIALSFFRRSRSRDREEVLCRQRSTADQSAIHVLHGEERRGVVRLHAAPVENPRVLENPFPDECVHR